MEQERRHGSEEKRLSYRFGLMPMIHWAGSSIIFSVVSCTREFAHEIESNAVSTCQAHRSGHRALLP